MSLAQIEAKIRREVKAAKREGVDLTHLILFSRDYDGRRVCACVVGVLSRDLPANDATPDERIARAAVKLRIDDARVRAIEAGFEGYDTAEGGEYLAFPRYRAIGRRLQDLVVDDQ